MIIYFLMFMLLSRNLYAAFNANDGGKEDILNPDFKIIEDLRPLTETEKAKLEEEREQDERKKEELKTSKEYTFFNREQGVVRVVNWKYWNEENEPCKVQEFKEVGSLLPSEENAERNPFDGTEGHTTLTVSSEDSSWTTSSSPMSQETTEEYRKKYGIFYEKFTSNEGDLLFQVTSSTTLFTNEEFAKELEKQKEKEKEEKRRSKIKKIELKIKEKELVLEEKTRNLLDKIQKNIELSRFFLNHFDPDSITQSLDSFLFCYSNVLPEFEKVKEAIKAANNADPLKFIRVSFEKIFFYWEISPKDRKYVGRKGVEGDNSYYFPEIGNFIQSFYTGYLTGYLKCTPDSSLDSLEKDFVNNEYNFSYREGNLPKIDFWIVPSREKNKNQDIQGNSGKSVFEYYKKAKRLSFFEGLFLDYCDYSVDSYDFTCATKLFLNLPSHSAGPIENRINKVYSGLSGVKILGLLKEKKQCLSNLICHESSSSFWNKQINLFLNYFYFIEKSEGFMEKVEEKIAKIKQKIAKISTYKETLSSKCLEYNLPPHVTDAQEEGGERNFSFMLESFDFYLELYKNLQEELLSKIDKNNLHRIKYRLDPVYSRVCQIIPDYFKRIDPKLELHKKSKIDSLLNNVSDDDQEFLSPKTVQNDFENHSDPILDDFLKSNEKEGLEKKEKYDEEQLKIQLEKRENRLDDLFQELQKLSPEQLKNDHAEKLFILIQLNIYLYKGELDRYKAVFDTVDWHPRSQDSQKNNLLGEDLYQNKPSLDGDSSSTPPSTGGVSLESNEDSEDEDGRYMEIIIGHPFSAPEIKEQWLNYLIENKLPKNPEFFKRYTEYDFIYFKNNYSQLSLLDKEIRKEVLEQSEEIFKKRIWERKDRIDAYIQYLPSGVDSFLSQKLSLGFDMALEEAMLDINLLLKEIELNFCFLSTDLYSLSKTFKEKCTIDADHGQIFPFHKIGAWALESSQKIVSILKGTQLKAPEINLGYFYIFNENLKETPRKQERRKDFFLKIIEENFTKLPFSLQKDVISFIDNNNMIDSSFITKKLFIDFLLDHQMIFYKYYKKYFPSGCFNHSLKEKWKVQEEKMFKDSLCQGEPIHLGGDEPEDDPEEEYNSVMERLLEIPFINFDFKEFNLEWGSKEG